MRFKAVKFILPLAFALFALASCGDNKAKAPKKADVMEAMQRANNHFLNKWPDPSQGIDYPSRNRVYESNLWTRGAYFEGLLALYRVDPDQRYIDYAVKWGESHNWGLRGANGRPWRMRNADNQCAGQAYIELYNMFGDERYIHDIKQSIDSMMVTDRINDWTWIDAIQMAMPIFIQLGVLENDARYFERAYEMYSYTKDSMGTNGLYNPADQLWWRDADFEPPYTEPNGEDCYWSRGNGWVVMALSRVLYFLPEDAAHRDEYRQMIKDMSEALALVQREDGLWNVSLHDPNNFGGKEFSGTAMFTFAMAYGVNNGFLDRVVYEPVIYKAWHGMQECIHPNGFIGYVQGSGKEPKEAQPVTYDREPDFDDYALGAFLLAGTEIYNMVK